VAFPFLAYAAAKWKPFLGVGTLALLLLTVPYSFWSVPAAPRAGGGMFHAYVPVANHAFLFLAGGVIAQARLAWKGRAGTPLFAVLGVALLLAFTLKYRNFYDDFDIMTGWARYYFLLLTFAAVALFAFYDFPPSPLRTAGKFLGEVSYSVYVLHPLVQEGIKHTLAPEANPWWGFSLGLALTLALSALTFRFIEKPMMGLGRRFCGQGRAAA